MAQADAKGDRATLLPLFRRTLLLVPLIATLVAVFLAISYEKLMSFWLGTVLETDFLMPLRYDCLGFVATASNTCESLLRARNRTSFLMWAMGVMATINLVLTLLLLPSIGPAGAIWGTVIGYFAAILLPYLWQLRGSIFERNEFGPA